MARAATTRNAIAAFIAGNPGATMRDIRAASSCSSDALSKAAGSLVKDGSLFMLRRNGADSRYFQTAEAMETARPILDAEWAAKLEASRKRRSIASVARMRAKRAATRLVHKSYASEAVRAFVLGFIAQNEGISVMAICERHPSQSSASIRKATDILLANGRLFMIPKSRRAPLFTSVAARDAAEPALRAQWAAEAAAVLKRSAESHPRCERERAKAARREPTSGQQLILRPSTARAAPDHLAAFKSAAAYTPPDVKRTFLPAPPSRYAPDPGYVGPFTSAGIGRYLEA